ncbi:McrB family protein [Methanotorris formicicus]|uniref:ATPase associated with various cellular activities AAA_5 n=1 Tax=Methanotorris formicicus Mc-S-70 TaxID=647171 RepID=H1KZI1_9EURY|nr:AAA family ATPase [Methanotorris formicicus]EHP85989.1 ATPase associated with various cellular activities AAA_5 [Methanotorris formicicus Mc-S-70]
MEEREFLEIVGRRFLEVVNKRSLGILKNQLKSVHKCGKRGFFRQLYLPEEISSITHGRVHFEWLVEKDKKTNQIKLLVGLHLECPIKNKIINQKIFEFLRERVNFEDLTVEENEQLEIKHFRFWKWISVYRLYSELNDDAVEWAVNSMIRAYEKLLPPLKEFFEEFGGGMGMINEERFKEILETLRNEYKDEWKKKKDFINIIEEVKEILSNIKDKDLTEEEVKKLKEKLTSLELFNYSKLNSDLTLESINHELVKKVLEIAINTDDDNFDEMIDKFGEKIDKIRSSGEIKRVATTLLTVLSTILNYKYFMPTWEKTIPDSLRNEININRFVGAKSKNVEDFKQFMKTANKIRKELGIDSMLEVAYYLSKFDGGESMTVKVKENKISELEKRLKLWKNFVKFAGKKYPHYDLTYDEESNWWLKNKKEIEKVIEKLEIYEENARELIKSMFISKNRLIFACGNIGVFKGFINGASKEKLKEFIDIIVEVKNSNEFKNAWIEKTYNLIYEFNKDSVEKYRKSRLKNQLYNIFGELYGKLHIEKEPIMNTCSRNILKEFYDFEEYNYNEFKEAFEMLKQRYKEIVRKLSEFPDGFINLEIDIMFNFFDKVKVWQLFPGENAEYLEEFYKNKRIYIGWGKIGDLSNILSNIKEKKRKDLEDIIRNFIKEKYLEEYKNKDIKHVPRMLLNFYKDMDVGDIVILKNGASKVVGICKIIGDYEYLNNNVPSDYNHSRKVEFWKYNPEGIGVEDVGLVRYTLEKLNWNKFAKIFERILNEEDNETEDNGGESIPEELKEKIDKILEKKGQIILYGVPGTGKTWLASDYVKEKTEDNKNRYGFITFHQSYSYEEFIEGLKPKNDENGNIIYDVEDGIFKRMCILAIYGALKNKENNGNTTVSNINFNTTKNENLTYEEIKQKVINAIKNKELTKKDFEKAPKYCLIIDEINRGNISNILGELITLLEKDKRLTEKNEIIATLPYSKEPFVVPPNLYIIGTMNTADRSIALLDIALRRRFGFLEIEPNYDKINKEIGGINLAELLKSINKKIVELKDKDHRIGHSYFLNVENFEDLWFVWYHEIIPLLEEYFYGDFEGLKQVLGEKFVDSNNYKIKKLEGNEFIEALKSIIQNNQNRGGE